MKGQQLFHSFLPGVTAAVLTTQPGWADTVKVTGVRLSASPSTLSATHSGTLDTNNINMQATAVGNSFPDSVIPNGITRDGVKPRSSSSVGVILAGKTGVPIEQITQKVQHVVLNWTPTPHQTQLIDKIRSASNNQKQTNTAIAQIAAQVLPEGNPLTVPWAERLGRRAHYPTQPSEQHSVADKLPRATETTLSKVEEATKLLEQVEFCPQQEGNRKTGSASLLLNSFTCRQQNSTDTLMAQSAPTPKAPPTRGPTGSVPIPDYLNPNPNPLQFPTRPEEVRIQGTQPITLAQALELARRNNRDLQVTLLTLERSRALLREAQADLFPNIDLNASIIRSQSASGQLQAEAATEAGQTLTQNPDTPDTTFSGSPGGTAQLSYDLYTSGRESANIQAAEEQLRSDELEVERQSEVIRLNVSTQYYDLQQADENVRINQSAVRNAEASLRDAQALERAGVSTRFEVLRSQVNLANFQQQLTNALSQQRITRRQLAQTLSLAQSVDISAADPVRLAGLWNQTLEQTIVLAVQNRPELQQRLADRNISEQRRRAALATIGPQVSVVASYDLLDQFDDQVGITDGYTLRLQASLRLFDGGRARAQADQQVANIRIAETQFANQRNQVRFEVEQAYSQLQANLESVQTASAALDQAREALRLARLRFQAGVGTQTEVIDAENELTRAEGNRVQAILDYNRALAQLQRAITSRATR